MSMYEDNAIQIIGTDAADMMPVPKQQNNALLATDHDNILYMAQKAEEYINAMNTIMAAALKITTENDWVLIGGKPYLQETGATKVARLFGISIQIVGHPLVEVDSKGYKTITYRGRFHMGGQYIEAEGSRSMKDEFFAGKGCRKKPDEIDERDVKLAAYTNCINNGIKKLIPGLRGLSVDDLEKAGFDMKRIGGYTFKSGSQGGNSNPTKAEDSGLKCEGCGAPITQKVASFSQGKFGKALCMKCQGGGK